MPLGCLKALKDGHSAALFKKYSNLKSCHDMNKHRITDVSSIWESIKQTHMFMEMSSIITEITPDKVMALLKTYFSDKSRASSREWHPK